MGTQPVIIRSYPKGIFLYPLFFASIVAAVIVGIWGEKSPAASIAGKTFMVVFAVNILVLAWDFTRTSFTVTVLSGIVAILLGVLIEREWDFLKELANLVHAVHIEAHPHFYLCFAAVFGLVCFLSFFQSRLDYWEVHGNELLHVTGFVKNVERFPSPNLTFTKTIPDVMEYCLLQSGTLVLEPAPGQRHVLTNVLRVNSIERRLEALLSTLEVTIDQNPRPAPGPPPGS